MINKTLIYFRDYKLFHLLLLVILIIAPSLAQASDNSLAEDHNFVLTFFWFAIVLLFAKISNLIRYWGQPTVLGELIMGVLLGNLALFGITFFEPIKADSIIAFFAELGVVILLFQIGLESNINKMRQVGKSAFLVACVGVITPFILGAYVAGPLLLPNLTSNAFYF